MPKVKKRKKDRKDKAVASLKLLSNLTGFGDEPDSLESCLEGWGVMAPSQQPVAKKANTIGWISSIERVESWNQSLLLYLKGGNYQNSLFENLELELARSFIVRELSSFLLRAGEDLRMPAFERWFIDSRLEQNMDETIRSSTTDPIIPNQVSVKFGASQRLIQELRANIKDEKKAESIVSELCRQTNVKCSQLLARSELYRRESSLKRGVITVEKNSPEVTTILYGKKKWKKPFCYRVNTEHYEKLRDRFFAVHNTATTKLDNQDERLMRVFNVIVISLLIRYNALSGGYLNDDLRGGGMQGAIHSEVFSVLQKHFTGSFLMEGFASPLNHCLPSFCSAFPEIEWHFGSMGSFMESRFTHDTCCELNPPFSPGLMMQMSIKILGELRVAKKERRKLTFVVVVPTSNGDTTVGIKHFANDSFQQMVTSPFCKKHIVLKSRTHGYIEGAAHLRPTRYKESNYDTSVIFLQSQDLPSVNYTQLERDIRESFASRHNQETQIRRSLN
ncbi:unnamed protein product [Cylindrotheca closterium]|uniref:PCIF1 WW domain-containing protein n=1 Tax=Cylindrotheca closterium TaxID=2856 RepID=A0AAD2JIY7_9STRA|nr:unnamed protein product [Cylindrotheca closterium]